ncbi:uncharacterized protein LY89DRAFT_759597 [Mollisia scopiformis]|uniref:Uncharacterized protein n=1 Tax=Mollisia scopiformis TaxID=149040 RepID=A0A194WRU6_MOLSC|nr:uncharacterized protein LY89DRAFT_759597 [Mollisia scopiformis]KUJ10708.1 hypothetical protein LY89DRAFT_759597 [Mollisia scopiformis]
MAQRYPGQGVPAKPANNQYDGQYNSHTTGNPPTPSSANATPNIGYPQAQTPSEISIQGRNQIQSRQQFHQIQSNPAVRVQNEQSSTYGYSHAQTGSMNYQTPSAPRDTTQTTYQQGFVQPQSNWPQLVQDQQNFGYGHGHTQPGMMYSQTTASREERHQTEHRQSFPQSQANWYPGVKNQNLAYGHGHVQPRYPYSQQAPVNAYQYPDPGSQTSQLYPHIAEQVRPHENTRSQLESLARQGFHPQQMVAPNTVHPSPDNMPSESGHTQGQRMASAPVQQQGSPTPLPTISSPSPVEAIADNKRKYDQTAFEEGQSAIAQAMETAASGWFRSFNHTQVNQPLPPKPAQKPRAPRNPPAARRQYQEPAPLPQQQTSAPASTSGFAPYNPFSPTPPYRSRYASQSLYAGLPVAPPRLPSPPPPPPPPPRSPQPPHPATHPSQIRESWHPEGCGCCDGGVPSELIRQGAAFRLPPTPQTILDPDNLPAEWMDNEDMMSAVLLPETCPPNHPYKVRDNEDGTPWTS